MAKEAVEIVEDLQKDWNEFKEEHKKGARADKEKLSKIEDALAKSDAAHQAAIQASATESKKMAEQLDRLEKLANRAALGAAGGDAKKLEEKKAAYEAFIRGGTEKMAAEQKTLLMGDDTAGGFLAPPEYVMELIKAEVLMSPMRSLVRVRTTGNRSVRIPKRTQTAAAKWVGETQTRVETTNPAFGLVEVPTQEMTAECYVSNQELEDSVFDIQALLTEEFSEQFGVTEGAGVVNGNGVGKPWGITDSSQAVPVVNSGTAAAIADANGQADGLITAFHTIKSAYAQNGKWLLNRLTMGAVRKLKDTQKRYLWEPSPAAGLPSTILGAPYVEVPDMDSEGANKFPMAFGDWKRCYTLVDRIALSILRDPFSQAGAAATRFVARRRVGGQVVLAEAAILLKCST